MLKGEQMWIEWKEKHRKKEEIKEPPVLHSRLVHDWIDTGLGPDYEMKWGEGTPLPCAPKAKKQRNR